MHVVHLTASTFFGGPERQMLGLAEHLPADVRTSFLSFREGGRCEDFLHETTARGFSSAALSADFPRVSAVVRELTARLTACRADVLLTHSYKPNILGRIAARRAGVPVVTVSRGWTGENRKVRLYERIDRYNLSRVDHVVAVSDGQAAKVTACGVPPDRVTVIRNSARPSSFAVADSSFDTALHSHFPADVAVSHVVVSAGRLSPEKGFDVLVEAAARVATRHPRVGFLHFGDGVERPRLEAAIARLGLTGRFVLAGFTRELDRYLPWADLLVLPSYTEGLPNVALEASAAGVAVVATAVGGTPEAVADGVTGLLVPPGDSAVLADRLSELLADDDRRQRLGRAGRTRMIEQFSFGTQAQQYLGLFARLLPSVCLHQRFPCLTPPLIPARSASRSSSTA